MGKAHSNALKKIAYMTWPPPYIPRLVAITGRTEEAVREAARRYGYEKWSTSWQDVVDDPDVQIFDNGGPNDMHAEPSIAAARAGKHVICEKPLAADPEGARGLVDAAARSGRQVAVPFVYRYYPMVREARERVHQGSTGPLRLLHGTYLQDWLLRPEDDNWRVDETLGGASRAFADIGSHWCDLAEFISGHTITRVSARLLTALPERRLAAGRPAFARGDSNGEVRAVGTEDAAVVQFETDQGALGAVVVSQISAGRKNRVWIELDGADESLAFDQEQPEELWCGRREAATIVRRDSETLSPQAARLSTLPAGHPQGYADCFDGFVADVYEAVRMGAPPDGLPVFADGLRSAHIVEAVLDSARRGAWTDVAMETGVRA
jgi:predicted dehydrogenase